MSDNYVTHHVTEDNLMANAIENSRFIEMIAELNEITTSAGHPIEGNMFFQQSDNLVGEPIDFGYAMFRKGFAPAVMGKKRMLEIGFNAGHSALLFLFLNPESEYITVDLVHRPYTTLAYEYISKVFPGRITLHEGDSTIVVPRISSSLGLFDVMHIDGGHTFDVVFQDIWNCYRNLAASGIMIVDDVIAPDVERAVKLSLTTRLLTYDRFQTIYDKTWQSFLKKFLY